MFLDMDNIPALLEMESPNSPNDTYLNVEPITSPLIVFYF